ncbi:MAG TPA: hypothetical protein VGH74_15525 [Planctomycetaceae bacterium]|jgi:hypothetical protein
MTRVYAEKTAVPIEKSRAEIEGILRRHGCTAFGHRWSENMAVIEFVAHDRVVRFDLPLPPRDNFKKRKVRGFFVNATPDQQSAAHDQACRQRWRALALAVKAKFEAIAAGISEFEEEFLAYVVDPETRQTIGELLRPQIAERYLGRQSGQLLLAGPATGPTTRPDISEDD